MQRPPVTVETCSKMLEKQIELLKQNPNQELVNMGYWFEWLLTMLDEQKQGQIILNFKE